jgi:hypothetical protein
MTQSQIFLSLADILEKRLKLSYLPPDLSQIAVFLPTKNYSATEKEDLLRIDDGRHISCNN